MGRTQTTIGNFGDAQAVVNFGAGGLGAVRGANGSFGDNPVGLEVAGVADALVRLIEPVLETALQPLAVVGAVGRHIRVVEANRILTLALGVLDEGAETKYVQVGGVVAVGVVARALGGGGVLGAGLEHSAVGDHGLRAIATTGLTAAVDAPARNINGLGAIVGELNEVFVGVAVCLAGGAGATSGNFADQYIAIWFDVVLVRGDRHRCCRSGRRA